MIRTRVPFALCGLLLAHAAFAAPSLKVLIVDGQNNHAWQQTTPVLKKILQDAGFQVDVATTPPRGGDMTTFHPSFADYQLVVSNYNGESWSPETKAAFEKYVREGGGFVSYHAADNSFPEWKEYNEMIAVGGWMGRSADKSGTPISWTLAKNTPTNPAARCGNHGQRLPFVVTMRDPQHPIAKGLPEKWLHTADELYDTLCGPAKDYTVIGTDHSDPANRGTGLEEPMLLTIQYGKGRVFHTTLGHDVAAMQCVGFITTLQRGAEWAATGQVKQKAPENFPTADKESLTK
jgi:type 1 glutamine amidotransferase